MQRLSRGLQTGCLALQGHAALQVRVAQLALGGEIQLRRGRGAMYRAAFLRRGTLLLRIQNHAAFEVSEARLVVLVKVHGRRGRRQAPASRRGQHEAARRVQVRGRSIVAKEDSGLGCFGLAVPELHCCCAQQAQLRGAVELPVLRMDLYLICAAIRRQLHGLHQSQVAALRVIRGAHRAPVSFCHREIHALVCRHHARVAVERYSAGLHLDLAGVADGTRRRVRAVNLLACASWPGRPRQNHLHRPLR